VFWFSGDEKITEIDSEDLEKIEDVLEHIAESKRELGVEVEDLEALKEDITEYQEVTATQKILSSRTDCLSPIFSAMTLVIGWQRTRREGHHPV